MGKKANFDFTTVINNAETVRAVKAAKEKKPSTSIKPLYIDPNPDDSALKAAIVAKINERNLVYSDLYKYCTDLKGGDPSDGQKLGSNIIRGLRTRPTMIDTTFSMLCDFLNLDILLAERKTEEDDDESEENEEA